MVILYNMNLVVNGQTLFYNAKIRRRKITLVAKMFFFF